VGVAGGVLISVACASVIYQCCSRGEKFGENKFHETCYLNLNTYPDASGEKTSCTRYRVRRPGPGSPGGGPGRVGRGPAGQGGQGGQVVDDRRWWGADIAIGENRGPISDRGGEHWMHGASGGHHRDI
jgi:hypothetical protein